MRTTSAPVALVLLLIVRGLHGQEQVLTLREDFGVSHPVQVTTFEANGPADPSTHYMVGPDGAEVPYQRLSGDRIAVLSGLGAGGQAVFRLKAGRAATATTGPVELRESPEAFEISNGLTGVRVPRRGSDLAPIQGIRLRDGSWSAIGPNYLKRPGEYWHPTAAAASMSAKVVERGPLVASVELSYRFADGTRYRASVTVKAGLQAIMIEEEADRDLQYYLDFYPQVKPNEARYRGHSSTSVALGREPDGRQYRPSHERGGLDAVRDLGYKTPIWSGPTSSSDQTSETVPRIAMWNPWASNTGWYWMVYDKTGGSQSPVIGIFAGRASRALEAGHSGPGYFSLPWHPDLKRPVAGFNVNLTGSKGTTRIHWGLFTGEKGADLGLAWLPQTIGRVMNVAGGINLDKVRRYPVSQGSAVTNSLYLSRAAHDALVGRVRSDKAYADFLYNDEPTVRPLLELWRDPSGVKASALAREISAYGKWFLNELVNGDGIYQINVHYWMGGLEMSRRLLLLNELLLLPELPEADRRQLGAVAVLFGSILWDDDHTPMFNGHGLNMGTANMPSQQQQYRNQFALFLSPAPEMRPRAEAVLEQARTGLAAEINEWGAHRASPHYVGASFGPLLNTLQQLGTSGVGDLFSSESRLSLLAGFLLNLVTPPEPRFGGLRKLISLGDGSTEGSELFGQLATGLAPVDAELSRRLMGAWLSMGKPQSGFHGTTVLRIDQSIQPSGFDLSSAHYPGYYSVLRSGAATRDETAAWIVNGSFYSDHRHADQGSMLVYALGAPLIGDWGSTYYPHVAGPYMHNSVLRERDLAVRWNADNLPLDAGVSPWKETGADFIKFRTGALSTSRFRAADGEEWARTVRLVAPASDNPILEITDHFSADRAGARVMTLNLAANSEVDSPAGKVVAPQRLWDDERGPKELPSATTPAGLKEGLNRFGFTGQWLIDWDLIVASTAPQEAVLSNWAHAWHPEAEKTQFVAANGRPFRERHQILRIRGGSDFHTILIPRRKPQTERTDVSASGEAITLRRSGTTTLLAPGHWAFENGAQRVLAAFSAERAAEFGLGVEGGAAEIEVGTREAALTLHGEAGARRIDGLAGWTADPLLVAEGDRWRIDYEGGEPLTVYLSPPGTPATQLRARSRSLSGVRRAPQARQRRPLPVRPPGK